MSYTSFTFFIIIYGAVFILYSLLPLKAKWCALLTGSAAFYFMASKGHIYNILAVSAAVWASALIIQKLNDSFKEKKKLAEKSEIKKLKLKYKRLKLTALLLTVFAVIASLFVFKYINSAVDTYNTVFNKNTEHFDIIQPLGISFYSLQAISYITDVYRGKYEADKNIFKVLLYLSFMLTVVEGPIARYNQLGRQLSCGKKFDLNNVVYGAQHIVWGMFKKIVIADRAAVFVSAVFGNHNKYGGIVVICAVLFYTLQLYCEFSGVMDIVGGMAKTMGIDLPENFRTPFFSKSIAEFWRRWHITLGAWLKDYIFYPISLSKPFRKFSKKAAKRFNPYYASLIPASAALLFVWLANGAWHGSGWKYVVYGLYYYILMILGQFAEPAIAGICTKLKINRKSSAYSVFSIIRTFIIVNIGMLIFRAESLKQSAEMVKSIFVNFDFSVIRIGSGSEIALAPEDYAVIVIGAIIVFAAGIIHEQGISIRNKVMSLPYFAKFIIFMIEIFIIIIFGAYGEGYGAVDLIYANF